MPLPSSPSGAPSDSSRRRLDAVIRHVARAQDQAWASGQVLAAMLLSMVEADLRVAVERHAWLPLPPEPPGEPPRGRG